MRSDSTAAFLLHFRSRRIKRARARTAGGARGCAEASALRPRLPQARPAPKRALTAHCRRSSRRPAAGIAWLQPRARRRRGGARAWERRAGKTLRNARTDKAAAQCRDSRQVGRGGGSAGGSGAAVTARARARSWSFLRGGRPCRATEESSGIDFQAVEEAYAALMHSQQTIAVSPLAHTPPPPLPPRPPRLGQRGRSCRAVLGEGGGGMEGGGQFAVSDGRS